MPTPKKPIDDKIFVRPGRHGDRLHVGKGIDPEKYPAPDFWEPRHQELWDRQLEIFAATLREVDMLTFRMYIDAQIEYDDLAEALYKGKLAAKKLTTLDDPAAMLDAVAMGQKALDNAFLKLIKLQDKMCANPYNRARVPEMKQKEKTLEEAIAELAK